MGVLEQILPYVPWVLLGILGLFVVFSMLFGLGRGFKRSLIRLGMVVLFIGAAFLLTPVTARFVYSWNINIAGHTPAGWVEILVANLQNADGMAYLTPLMPYIQNYVLVALGIVNMVLFIVLYFIAKWISWLIYAIVAHCWAPKKNKDGQKVKKHALGGMLVGLVQGVVLFFFLMIPVNGLVGLTDQVANYQVLGGIQVEQGVTTSAATTNDNPASTNQMIDVAAVAQKIDDALAPYQNVLRYTGLEFLSNKAFDYEMTVKVEDGNKVNLGKDLVTSLQLCADVNAFTPAINRVNKVAKATGDTFLGLAEFNQNDYEAMRYLVKKAFTLDLLQIGDTILNDLDRVLTTSLAGDGVILPGAENWAGNRIYDDSLYGELIKNYADPLHREEFITGVRAMVNYVASAKLDLAKQDALKMIDIMEDLFTLKITAPASGTAQPIAVALSRKNLHAADYFDILLAQLNPNDQYPAAYTSLDVMFKRVLELQALQIVARPKAANVVIYGNFFNGLDAQMTGLEDFLRTFAAEFLGEHAIGTDDNPGAWLKLRNLAKTVLNVGKDYVTVVDDFYAIVDELNAAHPDKDVGTLYPQAIMQYLSGLLGEGEHKYDKIDALAEALHDVCLTFRPVADFMSRQVQNLVVPDGMQAFGDFKKVLLDLLDSDHSTVADWQGLLHGVVDLTDLLTNNEVINKLLDIDFTDPDATKEIFTLIIGETPDDALLKPADVAAVIHTVVNMPNLGKTVNQVIEQFGASLGEDFDSTVITEQLKDLQNKEVGELTEIITNVWTDLRAKLQASNPPAGN